MGLRKSEANNKAQLAKLVLMVLTQGNEEWRKIIRAKYGIDEEGNMNFRPRQRESPTWHDLLWNSDLLLSGLRWQVVNASRPSFGLKNGWMSQLYYKEALN